jgi:hypothetical protein
MKRFLYLIAALAGGCLPDETLPAGETGEAGDYFIECYCRPGEEFLLVATTVLPLAGEVVPDLDVQLEVTITAGKSVPLYFRVYQAPGGFVYNHGSHETLDAGVDSIFLHARAPGGKLITARSVVPAPVVIDSARAGGNAVTLHFQGADAPGENYYLYVVQPFAGDEELERVSSLLDYSTLPPRSPVTRALPVPPGTTRASVSLRRLTRACYDYQVSLNEANSAQHGSITTPVPLAGNIQGAVGIFTCYTEETRVLFFTE